MAALLSWACSGLGKRRGLALALAALALGSGPARAAEGLYLTWDDCALNGGGASVKISGCGSDFGSNSLICALVMPAPADSVLGLELVVDIQHAFPIMPDWWAFQVGGCRQGEVSATTNLESLSRCRDPWQAQTSGGLLSYTIGLPRGGANQARMRIAFAVPSTQPRALNATDMYYAARIVLSNLGTGTCDGCSGAACLVLNSILVHGPPRPPGAPTTDVSITAPGPAGSNWAMWQASGASCQSVPIRKRTWGEVKSLYR